MGTFFEIESISPLLTPREFGMLLTYISTSRSRTGVRACGKRERIDQPRRLSIYITALSQFRQCWGWSNLLSTIFSTYSLTDTSKKLGFTSFKASFAKGFGVYFLVFWLTNIDPGEEEPGKLQ